MMEPPSFFLLSAFQYHLSAFSRSLSKTRILHHCIVAGDTSREEVEDASRDAVQASVDFTIVSTGATGKGASTALPGAYPAADRHGQVNLFCRV